jgi:hypothetical protein
MIVYANSTKGKDAVNTVRNHRGAVYVGLEVENSIVFIKAIKSDLLYVMQQLLNVDWYADVRNGFCYVTRTNDYLDDT